MAEPSTTYYDIRLMFRPSRSSASRLYRDQMTAPAPCRNVLPTPRGQPYRSRVQAGWEDTSASG